MSFGVHDLDEGSGLRGEAPAFAHDNAIGALGKITFDGDDGKVFVAGHADTHDDGNAETEANVFLDDFPSANFEADFVAETFLREDQLDLTPRAEVTWREDEGILRDVFQGDPFALGEGVIGARDEEGIVGDDGVEFDVVRDVEHGSDTEVDFAGVEELEAGLSRDVVEPEVDAGMVADELLDEGGQYILDGGAAGGDEEASAFHRIAPRLEVLLKAIETVDEGLGEFIKIFAVAGEGDFGAIAIEKTRVEFAFEGLNLEGDGGLAEIHAIGGTGNAPFLGGIVEAAQLLEAVVLVSGRRLRHGEIPLGSLARIENARFSGRQCAYGYD